MDFEVTLGIGYKIVHVKTFFFIDSQYIYIYIYICFCRLTKTQPRLPLSPRVILLLQVLIIDKFFQTTELKQCVFVRTVHIR